MTVDTVSSRVPARRPGNFGGRITSLREVSVPPLRDHLLAQMKVTKAKCLNTHLARHLWSKSSRFTETERAEAFPLGVDSPLRGVAILAARIRFAQQRGLRSSDQTACSRIESPADRLKRSADRTDFRSMTSRSDEGSGRKRADDHGASKRASGLQPSAPHKCVFQALCFGDFHLGQQMKVTRPPGRDPAPDSVNRQ